MITQFAKPGDGETQASAITTSDFVLVHVELASLVCKLMGGMINKGLDKRRGLFGIGFLLLGW